MTDWSNFKAALRAWKQDPTLFRKPKPPYYKKAMAQVIFYNETILGGQSGKDLTKIVPTNKCFAVPSIRKFKQVVITPKTFGSADGRIINADVNGSANIGRKVIRDEDVILRLDRSVAATPVRVNPLKFFCV